MVKTIRQFRDEMRVIREEMYDFGETADVELVASWLDRVVINLEKLSDTMELMGVELEIVSKRPALGGAKAAKKTVKKAAKKKAAKKPAKKKTAKKKAKKAKRRRR